MTLSEITWSKCILQYTVVKMFSMFPLCHEQFSQLKVFGEIYTSRKSRTNKSQCHAVISVWPTLTGISSRTLPCKENLWIGIIEYFIHRAKVKVTNISSSTESDYSEEPHVLAKVSWLEDHPNKFLYGNGIMLATTLFDQLSSASFIPVCWIMSRCAMNVQ